MLGEPDLAIGLRPQIQAALDHAGGQYAIEDLYCAVLLNRMQCWLAPKGEAVHFTELVQYPRLKSLRVLVSAGDIQALLAMTPNIARWALNTQQCTRVEYIGRPGWARVLGWRKAGEWCWADLEGLT